MKGITNITQLRWYEGWQRGYRGETQLSTDLDYRKGYMAGRAERQQDKEVR